MSQDVRPIAGGPATVRGVDPASQRLFGPGAPFGGCMRDGHLNLWLDGSVRYQKDGVSTELFADLTRINR